MVKVYYKHILNVHFKARTFSCGRSEATAPSECQKTVINLLEKNSEKKISTTWEPITIFRSITTRHFLFQDVTIRNFTVQNFTFQDTTVRTFIFRIITTRIIFSRNFSAPGFINRSSLEPHLLLMVLYLQVIWKGTNQSIKYILCISLLITNRRRTTSYRVWLSKIKSRHVYRYIYLDAVEKCINYGEYMRLTTVLLLSSSWLQYTVCCVIGYLCISGACVSDGMGLRLNRIKSLEVEHIRKIINIPISSYGGF